jgi:uncharacterized membrane protein
MSDLLNMFQWWLSILLGGLVFLPLTFILFKNFRDGGYVFSKIIAIAFISYAIFIFSWLRIFPFNFLEITIVFFIFFLLNFYLAKKTNFLGVLKKKYKLIVFEEIIFIAGLLLWSYIRGFLPDINGLEKFMDFGFVNSILRSNYFPPVDMWYSSLPINYYYFGHLVTAVLIKASIVVPPIGYNLMLATLFALTFTSIFSLVMNIFEQVKSGTKSILAGLLSAALVTFGGNLTTVYTFFQAYMPLDKPVPFWMLPFQPLNFPNDYWYPNATRFIEYTIHEFPLYSFVVSDLHGHVLDIPFVVLTLSLLFSVFLKFKDIKDKTFNYYLLLVGFLLSVMYMTNAWDGLIYFMLTVFILFFLSKGKQILNTLFKIAIVFLSFVVFSLPFSINFKPFASGIGVLCAPDFLTSLGKLGPFLFEVDHCQKSPLWQLIILYGFFYFFVFAFVLFLRAYKQKMNVADRFISLLIIVSTLLLIVPELIYLKDIYPAHYRANTMFKLSYEAFIMLSLSAGYIVFRILTTIRKRSTLILFFIPTFILIYMVLSYSIFAINSFYGELKNYRGLNGLSYLQVLYPGDYEATKWLNSNIKGQPIILEAAGDSYTNYARISSNTGLPTVIGWPVHEWLWRGTYDIVSPRIQDVETIYTSKDIKQTQELIKKYDVSYVIISQLEKDKYVDLKLDKFNELGRVVFESKGTKIYRINF